MVGGESVPFKSRASSKVTKFQGKTTHPTLWAAQLGLSGLKKEKEVPTLGR